jgi:hypothetical protein
VKEGTPMKKSVTLTGLGAVAFVSFVVYVWLTPYKYDHVSASSGASLPVRINRITGKTEILFPGTGWRSYEDAAEKSVENPQPWNAKALTASYDGIAFSENGHHSISSVYVYIIENETDQDYRVETKEGIWLTAKLAQPQSLAPFDNSVKIQYPMFIPSKQRLRVDIEIEYPDRKNLDGFVLFDTNKRYQINFPKGW